jgi:hypothetical protein
MKGMGGIQMADEKKVKIGYRPRTQLKRFHKRKQRWSALVCHRRAGKTVATLNDLIRGAVNECKHEGRYAFIFPQRNQAKDTAWRAICGAMQSRCWQSHPMNPTCVSTSSMAR